MEELRALAGIINSAVESIVGDHRNYPSMMNVPPSSTINHALMAAKQLIATLDPQYSVVTAFTVHIPPCLRLVIEAHIVEGFKELEVAPGKGVHVNDLAKFSAIDPKKLDSSHLSTSSVK